MERYTAENVEIRFGGEVFRGAKFTRVKDASEVPVGRTTGPLTFPLRTIPITIEVVRGDVVPVPVCGSRCAIGSPYDGVTCNLPPGHGGDHEAVTERHDADNRPRGVFDLLESWPQ